MITPSVSQILSFIDNPEMDSIPRGILQDAADRGIMMHDVMRDLIVMDIEPEGCEYPIKEFKDWYVSLGFETIEMETRRFLADFHGKPDWFGKLKSELIVLDWKFKNKVSIHDRVQVAGGYTLLTGAKKAIICHFTKKKFTPIDFNKTDVLKYQRLFLNIKEIFYTFGLQNHIQEDRSRS